MKAIFLDRDGVINKEVGYLHRINDFIFIDGVFTTLNFLKNRGYNFFIVTNQSGIGRGYYRIEDFKILNDWMLNEFRKQNIEISKVFFCPHSPKENCICRKPLPGLFHQALKEFPIELNESWMIGDKEDDISAANSAGIENTILVRSGHVINEKSSKAKLIVDSLGDLEKIIN